MDRRELLMLWAATAVLGVMSTRPASAQSLQLVFVHGRSQQGRSSDEIKAEWLGALQKGAEAIGRVLPIDLDVAVPDEDLHRTLRQTRSDWGELSAAWAEDDFEGLQQQAIQALLPLEVPVSSHRRQRVAIAEGLHAARWHGRARQ